MTTLTRRRLLFPVYPELTKAATAAQREATYQAALAIIDRIEPDPHSYRLTRHFESCAGEPLVTLDQVVQALIDGELA